jgi:predicted DNA-binding transcriptional regulator AlpA
MTIEMNDSNAVSIPQIREFLRNSAVMKFEGISRKEKYQWLENTLTRFRYFNLKKKDKGIVKEYLLRLTGFSPSQIGKLIRKKKRTGKVFWSSTKRNSFPTLYTPKDIALLVKTDNAHLRLSGKATKEIFVRAFDKFKDRNYENWNYRIRSSRFRK